MEHDVKAVEGNGMQVNTTAGMHQNQNAGGQQKAFVISRVFVAVVTKNPAMPVPDGNSFWVVRDKEGKPALEPVAQSLLAVPQNVILSISVEDCVGLLFYVRNTLMRDMSDFSGVQVNVVHTEAVYNSEHGSISTEMSLYPTQYIPLSATKITQNPPAGSDEEKDSKMNAETNTEEEIKTNVQTEEEEKPEQQ